MRICLHLALHAYPGTTIARDHLPSCVPLQLPAPRWVGSYRPKSDSPLAIEDWIGRGHGGTGISTSCASTTPLGLALAPDLPWEDGPCPGTLGHPAEGVLTPLSLLMPTFSLVRSPRLGYPAASQHARRSATTQYKYCIHSFGIRLEPRYIVRARSLDQ